MKTNLKILHETPDLDELAAKHQDFDALMDAYTDERIRKRRKYYQAGSFALVILATAFLSWLYWGYEPATENPVESQVQMPEDPVEKAVPVEKEEEIAAPVPPSEPVAESEKAEEEIEEVIPEAVPEPVVSEKEEELMASPQITIRERVTADATPVDGLENLYRYLYKEIDLPDSLLGTDNTFFLEVEFEVGAKGEIGDVSFNKPLPDAMLQQLSQVFAQMPAWKPALNEGDSVASIIHLPITFQKKGGKK